SRDIAEFFHAAGILLLEGYGLTETCPALTFNRPDRFKFGSVGQSLPGVQLRIAADGKIRARGPNIATLGYYKQPEATNEVFDTEGWFHTGDIGAIDQDGFLVITDRKKDLIVTAGGMNIAPQNIENLLKADPFISQVMVYGDRRPYPVALITINPEELSKFAREQGILTSEAAAIVKHPKVAERVGAGRGRRGRRARRPIERGTRGDGAPGRVRRAPSARRAHRRLELRRGRHAGAADDPRAGPPRHRRQQLGRREGGAARRNDAGGLAVHARREPDRRLQRLPRGRPSLDRPEIR